VCDGLIPLQSLVHLSLDNVYFNPLVDISLSVEASKLLAGCSRLTYLQVTRQAASCVCTDSLRMAPFPFLAVFPFEQQSSCCHTGR
jgi:hypothetical protein